MSAFARRHPPTTIPAPLLAVALLTTFTVTVPAAPVPADSETPRIGAFDAQAFHPLTDRIYDRGIQLDLAPGRLRIRYELGVSQLTMITDLVELLGQPIPDSADKAAQLYREVRGPILARGMVVKVGDRSLSPVPVGTEYRVRDHLEYAFLFECEIPPGSEPTLEFRDLNFEGERGFRRIALRGTGVRIEGSRASVDLEKVERVATWEMTPEQEEACGFVRAAFHPLRPDELGSNPASPAASADTSGANGEGGRRTEAGLADLLDHERFGFAVGLAAAFLFGMAHAVKPGHGKTLVAASLIGSRGTVGQAVALGITTTLTHTGTVLYVALMLRPLAGTPWASPELIRFWLMFLSGVFIIWLGGTLLWRRLLGKEDLLHVHGEGGHIHGPDGRVIPLDGRGNPVAEPHAHSTSHSHASGARHHHHHHGDATAGAGWMRIFALGVSGGLIPCDDAVLLLVWAIGAGLMAKAVWILLAFSAGLASVLILLGVLVVKVKGFAERRPGSERWIGLMQVASAALITLVGCWLCWLAFQPNTAGFNH
jgi:ABC-type nickel/cobalt efflux system permease component RcnA